MLIRPCWPVKLIDARPIGDRIRQEFGIACESEETWPET